MKSRFISNANPLEQECNIQRILVFLKLFDTFRLAPVSKTWSKLAKRPDFHPERLYLTNTTLQNLYSATGRVVHIETIPSSVLPCILGLVETITSLHISWSTKLPHLKNVKSCCLYGAEQSILQQDSNIIQRFISSCECLKCFVGISVEFFELYDFSSIKAIHTYGRTDLDYSTIFPNLQVLHLNDNQVIPESLSHINVLCFSGYFDQLPRQISFERLPSLKALIIDNETYTNHHGYNASGRDTKCWIEYFLNRATVETVILNRQREETPIEFMIPNAGVHVKILEHKYDIQLWKLHEILG